MNPEKILIRYDQMAEQVEGPVKRIVGFVNLTADDDQILRRQQLAKKASGLGGDRVSPSFALALFARANVNGTTTDVNLGALPSGFQSIPMYHAGQIQWKWTANFEAFDPFPAGAGSQVTNGVYRFVVDGNIRQGGSVKAYRVESRPFAVSPWVGIQVNDVRVEPGGSVSFVVPPIAYPRTYTSTAAPKFIKDDKRADVCKTCSFRPWASTAPVASAVVTVIRASGTVQEVPASLVAGRWIASTALQPGDSASVGAGGVRDTWGEINGAPSATVRS